MSDTKRVDTVRGDGDDSSSSGGGAQQQDSFSSSFGKLRLSDGPDNDQVLIKGKSSRRQKASSSTCNKETQDKLKKILMQRRPLDFNVDMKSLNTPLHRFLEDPENLRKSGFELTKQLNSIISELEKLGFLYAYVNMPNKRGRTPLSLCLKSECFVELISPLVRSGAQLHHLCGDFTERCNHLHYAMLKATPRVISATLDEVFNQHPFGADGMYALNRQYQTPKASLQSRIQRAEEQPQVLAELRLILNRIQGYPPVEGVSLKL